MDQRIMKYNPAFLTEEELIKGFVVREADLEIILRAIRENTTASNQHILIVGPRGIGKTTLVLRAAAEVRRGKDFRDRWYPIVFAEESYQISSPGEFWLEAIFHLGRQTKEERWKRTYRELKEETDDQRLRERALGQLMDFADQEKKRLLLVIENLNMLFDGQMNGDDAWVLRHTFLNESRVMLLATATKRFEEVKNADRAFFELFKIQELQPLNEDECRKVWVSVTGREPGDGRIRPIQILTGGNPRLLSIISKFGAKRSFKELMTELIQLVDDHTEYFRSHLDNLPAVERKVYLSLVEKWDPCTAREVAQHARLDVSKTSSLLNRLVDRGAVTVKEGGRRTKTYQVAERLYNIYYLMRRRGETSWRVKAVVNFMLGFYESEDLMTVTKNIAEEACGLKDETRADHYLAYQAILENQRDQKVREQFLKATPPEFFKLSDLPKSILALTEPQDFEKQVLALLEEGIRYINAPSHLMDAENAFRKAIDIEPDNAIAWSGLGMVLFIKQQYEDAKNAYRKVIELEPSFIIVWFSLGNVFEKLNQFEEAIKTYDNIIRQFEGSENPDILAYMARAMVKKGLILGQFGQPEKEIEVYNDLLRRFEGSEVPEILVQIARGMINKGITLGQLGQPEKEIEIYDDLLRRFEGSENPDILVQVAEGMMNKGITLGQLGQPEKANEVYDDLLRRFEGLENPDILVQVARAMVNKGVTLGRLGQLEKAIEIFDDLLRRFEGSENPDILVQVAKAMVNKGVTHRTLGQLEKATEVFDALLRRFEESENPDILERVVRAMINKGITLGQLGQPEKEIEVYDDLLQRFEESENQDILVRVARAMVNKGITLGQLGQPEKTIEVYDGLLRRFEGSENPDILVQVAMAMVNKGVTLGQLGQPEKEIEVYDGLLRRFEGSENPDILVRVARAMVNKGITLGQLGQPEKAIEVYDGLLRRFEGSETPDILSRVIKALVNKGKLFIKIGRLEEAEKAFRRAIEIKVDDVWIWETVIQSFCEQPNLSAKALALAEEMVGKYPKNSKLLYTLAAAFRKHGRRLYVDRVETWAAGAAESEPENSSYVMNYALVLCEAGKGEEALEAAGKFLGLSFLKEDLSQIIDFFVKLAALGKGREALAILSASPKAAELEPLVVGLKLFLGEEVTVAEEIMEIGKDVVKRIQEEQKNRQANKK